MLHYYAIAERGGGKTWWISFPGGDGIISAADKARDRGPSAGRASLGSYGRRSAAALDFEAPVMVVVTPFEAEAEAREAA